MKYHFLVLQEAKANTASFLKSQTPYLDNDERDFYTLATAMAIAKMNGNSSYDNVMEEYASLGGKYSNFYNNPKLKPYVKASVESHMSSIPDASNERSAVRQVLETSPSSYGTLDFLTRFNGGIKNTPSSADKVSFVYQCYIGDKIPEDALEDKTWQNQVFDVTYNYKMSTLDFCKVFSAYTLAFNYKGAVDPNREFLANNRFVEASQADVRYAKMKKQYSGDEDKRIDWINIGPSSKTLIKIFNLCDLEMYTSGDKERPTEGDYIASVRVWLYPNTKYDVSTFKKRDYDDPQLLVPNNYKELAMKKSSQEKLRKMLGNNDTYKDYFNIR